MNRLCRIIEKWDRNFRWKRRYKDFDYTIMIDDSHTYDALTFAKIEDVFIRFGIEMKQLRLDEIEIRKDRKDFVMNWQYYYELFRKECEEICPDKQALANIAVRLSYEKYKKSESKFMWRVAPDGILANLRQVPIKLPIRDKEGDYEYLGRRYSMVDPILEGDKNG